ncbi:MAG: DUF4199 family protein [Bacteroidales bacterium]|nr:DUF4199 family protein [Bacteroidales bacterium]
MRNWFKTAILWGIVLGAGLSALELLKMLARRVDYPFGTIADLMMILLFIAVLVKCAKTYRDNVCGGLISFGKAFGLGAGMVGVAFFFSLFYLIIHYSFIEKDGIDRINKAFEQKYQARLAQDTVSMSDIDTYISNSRVILSETKSSIMQDDTACNTFVDSKIDMIFDAYSERLRKGAATDTADYHYGKFDAYAQKILVNTLEQMLNENVGDTFCTPVLSRTVLASTAALDSISPLQLRLECEKDSVPHYSNVLALGLFNSVATLLYGLFFNIFTSLYIYRKKKNSCGADNVEGNETETPQETTNE